MILTEPYIFVYYVFDILLAIAFNKDVLPAPELPRIAFKPQGRNPLKLSKTTFDSFTVLSYTRSPNPSSTLDLDSHCKWIFSKVISHFFYLSLIVYKF